MAKGREGEKGFSYVTELGEGSPLYGLVAGGQDESSVGRGEGNGGGKVAGIVTLVAQAVRGR